MSNITLGTVPAAAAERDAIHVAVLAAMAHETLQPGQRVQLIYGTYVAKPCGPNANAIGIVDPFLTAPVAPRQRFWLLMLPGSIGNLRHDWSHPALEWISEEEEDLVRCHQDGCS